MVGHDAASPLADLKIEFRSAGGNVKKGAPVAVNVQPVVSERSTGWPNARQHLPAVESSSEYSRDVYITGCGSAD